MLRRLILIIVLPPQLSTESILLNDPWMAWCLIDVFCDSATQSPNWHKPEDTSSNAKHKGAVVDNPFAASKMASKM